MTTNPLLATLIPLVADLSRDLPEDERYRRLLQALRDLLPCDATALLRLDGEYLIPLAVDGLSPDTLGRRFRVGEHPRLEALLERRGPTRFPADCGLPDPYDGLVEGLHGHLEIHDCLGCPLYLDDQPWGLLTLDTLDPSRFASADLDTLEAFASLAAATVKASERMRDLTRRAEDEHQRAEAYLEAAGERPRNDRPERRAQGAAGRNPPGRQQRPERTDHRRDRGRQGTGGAIHPPAFHAQRQADDQSQLRRAARDPGGKRIVRPCARRLLRRGQRTARQVRTGRRRQPVPRRGRRVAAGGAGQAAPRAAERAVAAGRLRSRAPRRRTPDRSHQPRPGRGSTCRALPRRSLPSPQRLSLARAAAERGRDILLLAGYFLEENRPRLGLRSLRLDHEAQAALLDYRWPGNVRELEHLVGRASLKALGHNPERSRIVTLHRQDLDLPAEPPRHLAAWSSPRPPCHRPVTRCARPPTPTNAA